MPIQKTSKTIGESLTWVKGKKPAHLFEVGGNSMRPYLSAMYFRTRKPDYYVSTNDRDWVPVNEDDVVLIWDGSNAGDVFRGLKGALSSTMVRFNKSKECDEGYLYFLLKNNFKNLNGATTGSTIPHVSGTVLKQIKIPVLDVSEQKAIVQILMTTQSAIVEQENLVVKLKELKWSLTKHLFIHGTKGEKTKMLEIGEAPESWPKHSLGEFIDVVHGNAFKGEYFTHSGPIVLTPGNFLLDGGLYWGEKTKYTKEQFDKKYILKSGDLVVVMTDLTPSAKLLGSPAFIPVSKIVLHNQRIGKVVLKSNDLDLAFLYWLFLSPQYKKYMQMTATGSTVRHSSPARIKEYVFALPSKDEQSKIANSLNVLSEKIEKAEQKLGAFQNLFKTLLHELVSGERKVFRTLKKEKRDPKDIFKDAFLQTYLVKSLPGLYVSHIRLEKTTYFTKRFLEVSPVSNYSTYTFGPYDPLNKYKGGLKLALNKKYIEPGDSWGYKVGRNINQINEYTYLKEVHAMKTVLTNLGSKPDNELEILSTVDFSIYKLLTDKIKPTPKQVLDFINSTDAWKEKIQRLKLDESKIAQAMNDLRDLVKAGLPYPKI